MLNTLSFWVIVAAGLWLILISSLMIQRPESALRYLGQMASTHLINLTELLLRLVWGLAMVQYAERSLYPEFSKIFGMFLAVSALLLLVIPRRWHSAYAVYWSKKLTPRLVQWFAPVSFFFGVFLIWIVI